MKQKILLLLMLSILVNVKAQKSLINLVSTTFNGVTDTVNLAPIIINSEGNPIVSTNEKVSPTQYDARTAEQLSNGIVAWTNLFNTSTEKCFTTASTTDDKENIYVCGGIRVANSGTGIDFFVIKYDMDGNQIWVYYYNGPNNTTDCASDIYVDASYNVYVTGVSDGTGSSVADYATIKLDANGNQSWVTRYDNGSFDVPYGIELSGGRLVVTGSSALAFNDWDVTTITYNALTGNQDNIDIQAYGASTDMVFGMVTDSLGNVYTTGRTANNIEILKLDTALNTVWVKSFDGHGFDDAGLSIALDDSMNVLVTGFSCLDNLNSRELVVLKYDNSGNFKWKFTKGQALGYGNAEGIKVFAKSADEIFVGGNITSANQDLLIMRLNKKGNLTLEKTYNGPSNAKDKLLDMAVDANHIFVSARTYSTGALDQNITLTYKYIDIAKSVVTSSLTPKRSNKELLVSFQPDAINATPINNRNIEFGELHQFLTSTAMTALNASCSTSVSKLQCSKVLKWLTKNDSLSITRTGDTIKVPPHWSTLLVYLPSDANDTSYLNQFKSAGAVIRWVEFDEFVALTAGANDTHYNNGNSSNLHASAAYPDANINIEPAWDLSTGTPSVLVGVFDSGINFTHQDFGNGTFAGSKIAGGEDFVNGTPLKTTSTDDPTGHGTAVAGIVGALRNNNFGTAGVGGGDADSSNTGLALYNMRTHDTIYLGCGGYTNLSILYNAIIKGALSNSAGGFGLHINNHSWTNSYQSVMSLYEAFTTAFSNRVVLSVASDNQDLFWGNPCTFYSYPANFPDRMIMQVGANDTLGDKADFSQCGANLDFIAPGVQKLYASPTRTGSAFSDSLIYSVAAGSCTAGITGTSFAAPHAAGVAGLMKSYDKKVLGPISPFAAVGNFYPEDIEEIMQLTVTDITLTPNYSPGYDAYSGYGRINAGNALNSIKYPDYIVEHKKAIVSASTAVLVGSNEITCNWANIYGITTPTTYVNRYKITANVGHTIPNGYNFIKGWDLDAGSNILGLNSGVAGTQTCSVFFNFPNYRIPSHTDVTSTVTATNADLVGYIYEVLTPTVPTTSLGWYPPQFAGLTGSVTLAYTLYYKDQNVIGVNENIFKETDLSIYPNPANDKVIIAATSEEIGELNLKVYNVLGQLMIEEKIVTLTKEKVVQVSGLRNGLYFFELTKSGTKVVKKIIIAH